MKVILVLLIVMTVLVITSNSMGLDENPKIEVKILEKNKIYKELDKKEYASSEVLVKFKTGTLPEKIKSIFQEFGVSKVSEIKKLTIHRLKVPSGITVAKMVENFRKNPFIEFAEPNYIAYASMVPNDPYYQYQWHFDNLVYGGIHMESAWDLTTGNPNVVVAVVDTGVAYEDYPGPGFWHRDTYNAYGGSGYSWWDGVAEALPSWTALYGTDPTPPGYGNGWKEYLQHSFDLIGATGTVILTYKYRHNLEVTGGVAYDKAYTEVSTNNGTSWTILKTYTGKSRSPQTNNWKSESIDLTSYKGNNILLRFRFNSDESYSDEDGYFNSDGAVYIDEIKLVDGSGTLFYDNAESGTGNWQTTQYKKAPDLAGTNFAAGYDFVNNDSHPNDDEGHGTHVTGTIAQTTNNNLGVAGIAFSTSIMPVKVLNSAGTGTYGMVASGIIYATDNGADIISMSLGGSGSSTTLKNAVDYAYKNGVAVIAACGNSNVASCDYPAAYGNVTAVGATQFDETKTPYSNYGPTLDLVAPGGNTGVDQNNDGYPDGVLQQTFGNTPVDFSYWFYQGTSMSTPHVSGVAALLLAVNSSLTPDDIKNTLQSTAGDLGSPGRDDTFGWGLVNASAAVEAVMPTEFISITLYGYPIGFGNLDPGTNDNPAAGNSGNPYKIRVDSETTVNVDLYQKGGDFASGGNTLAIENMTWSNTNDAETSLSVNGTYDSNYPIATNVSQDTNTTMYYWLDVPTGQKAADYSATVYIKAVETGNLP